MSRPAIAALAGVLVLALAIFLSVWSMRGDEQPSAPPTVAAAPAAVMKASPVKPAELSGVPSFDIVRINPQGDTVIAGRAMPKAEVSILDGGTELGHVTADDRGEWVFVPDKPLAPGARELSLIALNPDGSTRQSEAPVVLTVPDRSKTKDGSLAVKINPDGSISILQGPEAKTGAGTVSIAAVKYDDRGRLSVAGSAPAKAVVQVYLDGKSLAKVAADDQGKWHLLSRQELRGKSHVVRADELGADGKVAARAEITFTPAADLPGDGKITVEAGTNLWRIARKTYGSGFDFLVIFQANKDQIRDPNKIYPGQVFQVPAGR